jgi:hypothetical protein
MFFLLKTLKPGKSNGHKNQTHEHGEDWREWGVRSNTESNSERKKAQNGHKKEHGHKKKLSEMTGHMKGWTKRIISGRNFASY